MVKQDARPRSQESGGTRITRRRVAQGVAWSVPVVAVATTVPAFAASRCEIDLVLDVEASCKDAPNEKLKLNFKITNGACPVPEECAGGTIDKIVEGVGNPETLFDGSVDGSVDIGTAIVICGTDQQSGQIVVTATIPCVNGGEPDDYPLKLNQQGSTVADCDPADPLECTTTLP